MKIKDGLMLCRVGEEYVVLAGGENADLQIRGLTTLNETGAFIWETLQEDKTEADAVDAMLREFDIDRASAEQDVAEFCALLRRVGFLA